MERDCFVISPIGELGSTEHERVNSVFFDYLVPACERAGYKADRSDLSIQSDLKQQIVTRLLTAPMAVAYLGAPQRWNPNVMIEVGVRTASRKPLVFVRDQSQDGAGSFPLGIDNEQIIVLPGDDADQIAQKGVIRRIADQITIAESHYRERESIETVHALVQMEVPVEKLFNADAYRYTEASALATKLFGMDGVLVGRSVADFLTVLQERMQAQQYQAFFEEQRTLMAVFSSTPDTPPTASVPIVISQHSDQKYIGRAYLPIIVRRYAFFGRLVLRILYLDVTGVSAKGEKVDYFTCPIDPRRPPLADLIPECEESNTVFLAYNSLDREMVRQVHDLIDKRVDGFVPWMDDYDIHWGDRWAAQIEEGLQRACAVFVFLGAHGLGPVQQNELKLISNLFLERNVPLIPVLLPDLDEMPDNLPLSVRSAHHARFDELLDLDELKGRLAQFRPAPSTRSTND